MLKNNSEESFEVKFLHPRNSSFVMADVSSLCTGMQAIECMMANDSGEPFLAPVPLGRSYELFLNRTQQAILPNMTLAQAGVIDGDVIEVRQAATGAGFDLSAIAEILITSGVTLATLKAFTQILVKLIENQGKKSVTLKLGDGKEIVINGSNSIDDLIKVVSALEYPEVNLQMENSSTEPNKVAGEKRD